MKRILIIVLAVILTLTLLLTNVTFAAGGKKEVELAQQAGQAWLDSTVASSGEPQEWIGGHLTTPQVCYDLEGKLNAYMFAVESNGEVVGYIIVGSSDYGYPVFEAADVPPPATPGADEVKSTLKRDLGLKVEEIGNPTHLLLLGWDKLFAVYQAGQQEVAVDLKFDFAMPASNLTATESMPSPEVYKANTEATEQSKPEALSSSIWTAQSTSSGYNYLEMTAWTSSAPCSDYVSWCGPSSGVSIGRYYREEKGYSNLPATCNVDDYCYRNMFCRLYDLMEADIHGGGVNPWWYGLGFVAMAQECGYNNFRYYVRIFPELDFYWDIVDYINWGYPTAMCATPFYEDITGVPNWPPKKSHWVAIKGYIYPYMGYEHVVICTDSYSGADCLYLNWDYTGLFRCTCTIWTA